ncbi:MAG TPA: hypothetical protein ENN67_02115 [Firmicutes bacterium]|nr:hypothetical protein [Bacillota bacterium]
MPVNRYGLYVAVLVIPLLIFSCSKAESPISPSDTPSPLAQQSFVSVPTPREFTWGIFDIIIDPSTSEIDIIPIRGASFQANVTRFLQPPLAPVNLLYLTIKPETNFPSGFVSLDIGIQHPFPGTNLRGFDVMGIFIPAEGEQVSKWDSSLTWPSDYNARLLNPDGYTRWWNQVEFTSFNTIFGYTEGNLAIHSFESTCTLNPYKYYANGLAPDAPLNLHHLMLTDRGSFDTINPGYLVRQFDIQFPISGPKPDFRFKYAISSSYHEPNPGASQPAQTSDFPLSANRAEAVLIEIEDAGSWAFYENESTYGGDLTLNINITDWQGLTPFPGTPAEIDAVYAESPTLFPGVVNLLDSGFIVWEPGDPTTRIMDCTIPDVTPTGVVDQWILFIVVSANPSDYSVQLDGVSGFAFPENAHLASFILWEAPILDTGPQQNLPPVADASNTFPLEGQMPLEVFLDPSASFDPDGYIVLYEWDTDNDGFYDMSTVMPDIVSLVFDSPGEHQVMLRVTDNDDDSDELDEPLIVTVIDDDPCAKGPNLMACGDGNVFVDSYVDKDDNEQLFRNIINFDLGGPNSQNLIVKYYTGHGGTHNNSAINVKVKEIVESEGFILVDSKEEPIDTTDCRIIFVCLPGYNGGNPFTQAEYDTLKEFMKDGGRILLTQEYSDGPLQKQWGNDFLTAMGSTLVRLNTSTINQLHTVPNDCYAITDGVGMVFHPAYTSFELGPTDMSFTDDEDGYHVLVGSWIY